MTTTVNEEQIRPRVLFDEYLSLAEKDAKNLLATATFEHHNCFACGTRGQLKFRKHGFAYEECPECLTIFSNPRPSLKDLMSFYEEGLSTKFWATDFYKRTAESRREKLWRPKAKKVVDIIRSMPSKPQWICDIGGGYGLFAEELDTLLEQKIPVYVLEPSPLLANACRSRKLNVIEKFLEEINPTDLPSGLGVFTSFELFEHLYDPRQFLAKVYDLMPTGSRFIMTTLNGLGLDIRLLADKSKAVFPPHHLNFANPKSFENLYKMIGFRQIQTSTPGQLDLDILRNAKDDLTCDFWKSFFAVADENAVAQLQKAIADSGFSSHIWVVADRL